jgi:hypothetical protein
MRNLRLQVLVCLLQSLLVLCSGCGKSKDSPVAIQKIESPRLLERPHTGSCPAGYKQCQDGYCCPADGTCGPNHTCELPYVDCGDSPPYCHSRCCPDESKCDNDKCIGPRSASPWACGGAADMPCGSGCCPAGTGCTGDACLLTSSMPMMCDPETEIGCPNFRCCPDSMECKYDMAAWHCASQEHCSEEEVGWLCTCRIDQYLSSDERYCMQGQTDLACPASLPKSCPGGYCCPQESDCQSGFMCSCPPAGYFDCGGFCADVAAGCPGCPSDHPFGCGEECCLPGAECGELEDFPAGELHCACPEGTTRCKGTKGDSCCSAGDLCEDGECIGCPESHPSICGEVCCPKGSSCVDGKCKESSAGECTWKICWDPSCCVTGLDPDGCERDYPVNQRCESVAGSGDTCYTNSISRPCPPGMKCQVVCTGGSGVPCTGDPLGKCE